MDDFTLVLSNRDSVDRRTVAQAAAAMGLRVHVLAGWSGPSLPGRVRFYGEVLLSEAVADDLGLCLLDPPDDWLATCPSWARGRQVRPMTLEQARKLIFPTFVKAAEDKLGGIPGAVYETADDLPDVDPSTPVLVSEPVEITREYRLWCADGRVVTGSGYFRDGQGWEPGLRDIDEGEAVEDFAQRVLDECPPLPAGVVLDIGRTPTGQLLVIEANGAWGSGVYDGADPLGVLATVLLASASRDEEIDALEAFRREPGPVER